MPDPLSPTTPSVVPARNCSDTPFTAMARGDRLHLPDAPKARSDAPYRIVDIEHVIWTHGESVRVVTRLTVERA